jgi:hypothetical protein
MSRVAEILVVAPKTRLIQTPFGSIRKAYSELL